MNIYINSKLNSCLESVIKFNQNYNIKIFDNDIIDEELMNSQGGIFINGDIIVFNSIQKLFEILNDSSINSFEIINNNSFVIGFRKGNYFSKDKQKIENYYFRFINENYFPFFEITKVTKTKINIPERLKYNNIIFKKGKKYSIDFLNPKVVSQNQKKKYAIFFLYYPLNTDYLYGCLFNAYFCHIKNISKDIDLIFLSILELPPETKKIISYLFDYHYEIQYNLDMEFYCDIKNLNQNHLFRRWIYVANKLYIFHPEFLAYEKNMILDADVFIIDFEKYHQLFIESKCPCGHYEHTYVFKKYELIPNNFTDKGKNKFDYINTGLCIFQTNENDYLTIKSHLDKDIMRRDLPNLFTSIIKYPEQDYLTNLFSGKWHYLPIEFWSIANTKNHLCKIWEKVDLQNQYFSRV